MNSKREGREEGEERLVEHKIVVSYVGTQDKLINK